MPEQLDETSAQVAARLSETQGILSEAERIFAEETTAQHRDKWPNVYRLESAAKHAREILTLADPRITQLAAAEELVASATQARDAIRAAVDSGGGNLIDSADRLLNAAAQIKPGQLSAEAASGAVERLSEVQTEIEDRKTALEAASQELERAQESFETRESTLTKFLDDLTNVAAEVEFQKQAEKYEKESKFFWTAGLITLVAASCAAILPLILNYANPQHHGLDGQSNVSAHLGVALAFAAVSGVFLARARNRDRNRQRNRDLSVALITMFAYSEQIANEQEKERFKHDMGRLVLEAFLRQEPPIENRSSSILSELTSRATPASQPQESQL
jgi:DNA repair exonuclease SbcCD ATPase subunit